MFFTRYFSSGEKYAENVYNPPGVTEKCIYYSKNGSVISEKFFKSTKVCKEINYYPNSDKLIFKEVEYFDTGIQKSIKKYNTTGQITSYLIRENEKSAFQKRENI